MRLCVTKRFAVRMMEVFGPSIEIGQLLLMKSRFFGRLKKTKTARPCCLSWTRKNVAHFSARHRRAIGPDAGATATAPSLSFLSDLCVSLRSSAFLTPRTQRAAEKAQLTSAAAASAAMPLYCRQALRVTVFGMGLLSGRSG